ncbi:MAG: hypothetical protein ACXVB4_02650 [Pseudobdellovibrionaceae bacterium]
MASCHVCQAEIEITPQHYGSLFTCPKCSAVFFVDWEGQPEFSNEGLTGEASAEESSGTSDFSHETQEEIIEETPRPEEGEVANYDFSKPLDSWEPPRQDSAEALVGGDSPDLSDIADFGNADLGQAAFNYTLTISGIDSGSVRAQIEEAITDSKFNWNVIQLMAQINEGVLTIQSVNAVKASILMQRVKYLPVKISWRQNVLSGPV